MNGGNRLLVLMCSLLALEPIQSPAQDQDKFTPQVESTWKTRFDAITQEIEKLADHPWAGTYYAGDGLGANGTITLAPTNGFAYQVTGCLGVYDRNYGMVIETQTGLLKVNPKLNWVDKLEFVPVSWAQRRYLIRIDHIALFCDTVRSNHEPRSSMHGAFYLRPGDHEKPVTGVPVLPEQFRETCESLVNKSNPNHALNGFLAAFERLEWHKFRSYIADDACVIHPSAETPARICGKAEVEASFQRVFEQIRQSSSGPVFMELRPERLNVQMLGSDVAVTSFELSNNDRLGRRTIVWQKQETGTWKVVHLHASSMTKVAD